MKGCTYENLDRYYEKYWYEDAERQYHEHLAKQSKLEQQKQNGLSKSNKHVYQNVTSLGHHDLINNSYSLPQEPKVSFKDGNKPKKTVNSALTSSVFEAKNETSTSVNSVKYSAPKTSLADEIGRTIIHIKNSVNRINDESYYNISVPIERVSPNTVQALEARVASLEQEACSMRKRIAELEKKLLYADQNGKQAP